MTSSGYTKQPGRANRNSCFFSVWFSYFLHLHGNYFHFTVNKCKKKWCKIFSEYIYSFEHFRAVFETENSTGFPSGAIPKHMKVSGRGQQVFSKDKCHHCFQSWGHWRPGQAKGSKCCLTWRTFLTQAPIETLWLDKWIIDKVSGKLAGLLAQRVVISKVQLEARKIL